MRAKSATGKLLPLRRISGDVTELTDEALLAACATGDTASFGALFDRFHVAVYRFVSRLATTDELARDDLVQATFLELRRIAGNFRGQSSVKTWIFGVAANIARHQLRSEQRRRVHQARFLDDVSADLRTPGDDVDRKRLLVRIRDAMNHLPHDQRVAFIMCDLEQLSGVEVARVLDIPAGTLWRRLHEARRAVRASIEEPAS